MSAMPRLSAYMKHVITLHLKVTVTKTDCGRKNIAGIPTADPMSRVTSVTGTVAVPVIMLTHTVTDSSVSNTVYESCSKPTWTAVHETEDWFGKHHTVLMS